MTRSAIIALWVYRVITSVHALIVGLQPVLIGLFLQGDYQFLQLHRAAGGISIGVGILHAAAALLLWWRRRRGAVLALIAVALPASLGLQFHFGALRDTGLHIPLGVLLVATVVWLAVRSWRPSMREPQAVR